VTFRERAARTRAPISLQLIVLLVACVLAVQAISFAIILLMPPPRPPVYHVADVAAALKGGALSGHQGRPFVRVETRELPADARRRQGPGERALAYALGAPLADVRLVQFDPGPEWRFLRRFRGDLRREGFGPPPGGRPAYQGRGYAVGGDAEGGQRGAGPPRFERFWFRTSGDIPIVGDFTAAWKKPGGEWAVVRSTPEPFPNDWQRRSLMFLAAGFLLVVPAGYLFARRITAPLKRFSAAAEQLGRDPHAPPMNLTGPAEVGAAADAFNDMQARLKRYIDDRTAMVGAISHDLRTPLGRIKFKLESAPPALRDSVLADVGQMEQMIGGVLAFVRNENAPRRREKLDLLSVVECVVDDAALLGADVEITTAHPVMVDGDPVALQRLFANLVDNAVKYGGRARIRVREADGGAVVEITDGGPGLSPDDLERVFQPFYRADPSRNPQTGGVGLGLPIARTTARAHGGDVELASTPQGLTAIVTLPVAG
jgi:signal transduction histidine kinase